tara:strand:+ start:213 stop:587 length:375 start_codon:yes stop_codon:yes gene_type:complete
MDKGLEEKRKQKELEWLEKKHKEEKHVLVKSYYENGQLKSEEYYKDNMLDSVSKYYYKNGVIERIDYNWKKWTLYQKNYRITGKIESEGGFRDFPYRDGVWKYYHENGQLKEEKNFKEGVEMKK